MTRDFVTEMRAAIDKATSVDGYVPRLAATELVKRLRAEDPVLLQGWLEVSAEHFVWQAINDRDRSVRAATRHQKPRLAFSSAVAEHSTGNSEALRRYLDMPYTVGDGTRKRLAALDHDDLTFVGSRYAQRAAENALMESFFVALAKKVQTGTVEDHYDESQISAMFESFAPAA